MGYEQQQVLCNCKVCCMPLIITSNELLCCLYKEHIKYVLRLVTIHLPLLGKDTG